MIKVGASSHIYMPKTSISSRIKNFRKGPLRIFPLDGKIKGEVVVGTTDFFIQLLDIVAKVIHRLISVSQDTNPILILGENGMTFIGSGFESCVLRRSLWKGRFNAGHQFFWLLLLL